MDAQSALVVPRSERPDRVGGDRRQSWAFGQRPAVRAPESQLAVRLSLDLIAVFVDGTVVPTTKQGEIRQRRGPSVSPVPDVMTLAKP